MLGPFPAAMQKWTHQCVHRKPSFGGPDAASGALSACACPAGISARCQGRFQNWCVVQRALRLEEGLSIHHELSSKGAECTGNRTVESWLRVPSLYSCNRCRFATEHSVAGSDSNADNRGPSFDSTGACSELSMVVAELATVVLWA